MGYLYDNADAVDPRLFRYYLRSDDRTCVPRLPIEGGAELEAAPDGLPLDVGFRVVYHLRLPVLSRTICLVEHRLSVRIHGHVHISPSSSCYG